MPRYLCLIYLDEPAFAALPAAEVNRLNREHLALNERLRASGVLVEAEALQPSAATTTMRLRDGARAVTDGPFAESKEVVAGFYLIDVPDLDAALAVAEQFPSAHLATVEVREVAPLVVTDD